ncbi:MAG TPA: DEAD/DEAH box helicase [Candidatus Saccharimonadales bacterium]
MPYHSYNRRPNQVRQNFRGRQPVRSKLKKDDIHRSKFIKPARSVEAVKYEPKHLFSDFAMSDLLHRNVQAKGIVSPSPIQDQAIPVGLAGQDVVGIANTGTGKTIAFALPVFHRLMSERGARALILAPTRELAQQIEDECRVVAKGSGLFGTLLIGGSPMGPQLRDLRSRPHLVIGTPGRIKDHIERGSLELSAFNIIVLDEVDRMLDMGFVNDVRKILSGAATNRQSFFFSATLDERVKALIKTFSHEPVIISVKTGETTDNVEQNIVPFDSKEEKIDKLQSILANEEVAKVVVFDDTQRSVERLSKKLQDYGFKADAIHGGKTQGQRQRALSRFKENNITILIATDVAARGLDVPDVTHVINFSTPKTYDDYVHRIGRAGRAGKKGYALTFVEN